MLKKIMLVMAAAVVLIGVENLAAQEGRGRPEAEPQQRQARQGWQSQRGQTQQPGRERTEQKAARRPTESRGTQTRQQPRVSREAGRSPADAVRGRPQQFGRGQTPPSPAIQTRLAGWLDELTKAYRENDREKMGQLLRRMNEARQRVQRARGALGERLRDLRGRAGAGQGLPGTNRGWPGIGQGRLGQLRGCPYGRWQGLQRRGIGGWGQGTPDRGIGRPGQGFQHRGGWGQGTPGRGIGGPGRGFQPRGMGAPRRYDVPGPKWDR